MKPVPVLDAAASSVPYGAIPWCFGSKLVSRLADLCISEYASTCGSGLRQSGSEIRQSVGVSTECRSISKGKGAANPCALRRCEKPCGERPCEASDEDDAAPWVTPCLGAASTSLLRRRSCASWSRSRSSLRSVTRSHAVAMRLSTVCNMDARMSWFSDLLCISPSQPPTTPAPVLLLIRKD